MKKLVLLMIIVCNFTFSNSFDRINSLSAKISEKTVANKNIKEKAYIFQMKYPNKVYKEMISPKINLGEKYVYNGNKKSVYYPLLKESFKEEINADENYILQAIKVIKEGKNKLILVNNEVKEVKFGDGIKAVFSEYKNIDEMNFPFKVMIYQDEVLYSTLYFADVKINSPIDEKIFKIAD